MLKVGGVPRDYRIDVAWQPPPVGTVLKFEGEDRLKFYGGSYRYGDSDPTGTIRVDGQVSTREALEKKAACGSEEVPPSGTGSASTTR